MNTTSINWTDIAFQFGWLIFLISLVFLVYKIIKIRQKNKRSNN